MLGNDLAARAALVRARTTGLAADPAGLHNLRSAAQTQDPESLEAAARAFEALLVGQMLKQMRAASFGGGPFDSSHSELYRDLHDQEIARLVSEGEGLGFRPLLMRQLGQQAAAGTNARDPETLRVPERNPWLRRRAPDELATDTGERPLERARRRGARPARRGDWPAPPSNWPPTDAREFVRVLRPHAEAAARELGFDPNVLLAQSALETAWGRRMPRHADGRSSYNLFGIKADRRWDGDRVGVGTLEYRNGVAQRERANFRAYANPAESFADYVAFLRANPRYREALASTNSREFVRRLQRAGYATDPAYANKILSIYDRMRELHGGQETAQRVGRSAATQG